MKSELTYIHDPKVQENGGISWLPIPLAAWETVLRNYFFEIADGFGFMKVESKGDLFPNGLDYFANWELVESDFLICDESFVCKFELNAPCQDRLLEFEFAVHQVGMGPPVPHDQYDTFHHYYEYDELYFFEGEKMVGRYIEHEQILDFFALDHQKQALLARLPREISQYFFDNVYLQRLWGGGSF